MYHLPKLVYDEILTAETKTRFVLRKLPLLSASNVYDSLFNI